MYLDDLNLLAETAQKLQLEAPAIIRFGRGQIKQLPDLVNGLAEPGATVVLLAGSSYQTLLDQLQARLSAEGVQCELIADISGEPTTDSVDETARQVRKLRPQLVIACGGGSVIDTGKAVSALATNDGLVEEFLEGVGTGRKLETDPLPMIAIPTTSGTGAEMTKNAVISNYREQYKKSFRDQRMIPATVILDPELTTDLPAGVTVATGLDALTQLLESAISRRRTDVTTALACEALAKLPEALLTCFRQPYSLVARERMMIASAVSGICLANSGLGLAHGLAAALGAVHRVGHGIACGVLLPHVMEYNRAEAADAMGKAFAAMLGEKKVMAETIDRGIARIKQLLSALDVPSSLRLLPLLDEDLRLLAEKAQGNSLSGNPVEMDAEAVYQFLKTVA